MIAWQKAHLLTLKIYNSTSSKNFRTDYDLLRQIRRCAISIPSNIAEGFERSGNKEFVNFLSIAKGSNGELQAQLILAKDLGYISEVTFSDCITLSKEVGKIIIGLIKYLKTSNQRGYKFSEPEVDFYTSNSELNTPN